MIRSRLARIGTAVVLSGFGFVAYDAVTQVASAQAPPVINTDFAAYPPPGSIPASCAPNEGVAVLQGYRSFIQRAGAAAVDPFVDPGPGAVGAAGSMRRFQGILTVGDKVVIRWTGWTPGCEGVIVSFPLKATTHPVFDPADDQALVREPNGPFVFPFCHSSGPDTCPLAAGGFELTNTIPQLHVVCGFQLDAIIGSPLETIGPHGSYYQNTVRQTAVNLGLGTFNITGPNMLIDAANGGVPCTPDQRIVIDKQWVGSGAQPPTNVPPDFLLTVTSSVGADPTVVMSTATCRVVSRAFACNYVDTAAPGVPQGGLLVNPDSLLTATETGFPGNMVDITFPVGTASKFVNCVAGGGPCLFTLTNTPPPPPETTTTTTTTAPTTTVPPTTTPTTSPTTSPITITLPATGSSSSGQLTIFGLVMVPIGATLVLITRRRAEAR